MHSNKENKLFSFLSTQHRRCSVKICSIWLGSILKVFFHLNHAMRLWYPAWRHYINYDNLWYLGTEVIFLLLSAKEIHCTFMNTRDCPMLNPASGSVWQRFMQQHPTLELPSLAFLSPAHVSGGLFFPAITFLLAHRTHHVLAAISQPSGDIALWYLLSFPYPSYSRGLTISDQLSPAPFSVFACITVPQFDSVSSL